jgi:hypothetical protein
MWIFRSIIRSSESQKDKAVDSLRLAILLTGVIPTEDADALAEYVDQLMGPESGARMRDTLNLIKEFNRRVEEIQKSR